MVDNACAENATINVPRVICPLNEEQWSLLHSATLHIKTKDWYDPAVYLVAKLVCNALLENWNVLRSITLHWQINSVQLSHTFSAPKSIDEIAQSRPLFTVSEFAPCRTLLSTNWLMHVWACGRNAPLSALNEIVAGGLNPSTGIDELMSTIDVFNQLVYRKNSYW